MTKTLSSEAIQLEIENCSDFLEQLNKKCEVIREKVKRLTDRVDVLNALDSKLPNGGVKNLNFANLNSVADERNKEIDEFAKVQRNIEQYNQILETLIQLRDGK